MSATAGEDRRTFEELMSELESLTAQLASGDLGIESAVDLYERACTVHALALARLEQVKSRVERLAPPKHAPSETPRAGAGDRERR